MIYYLNFEKPVDYPGCGEPDFASACRRGKVPTGPLEKLGTDCDDRKRKYSLPRIFSVRLGPSPIMAFANGSLPAVLRVGSKMLCGVNYVTTSRALL